jgi:hypothetical protein
MRPEEKARQEIDRQLDVCGWKVQNYRQMNISAGLGRTHLMVLTAAITLLVGCTPGFHYSPIAATGNRLDKWSKTISGVTFQGEPYWDAEDVENVFLYLTVTNASHQNVVITRATLAGSGGSLEAQLAKDARVRTIPPDATLYVPCSWELPKEHGRLSDYLGGKISLNWQAMIGDEQHAIVVEMARSYEWVPEWLSNLLPVTISLIVLFLACVFVFLVYWLPTIVAYQKNSPYDAFVAVLNLIVGWTVVGWVACFVGVLLMRKTDSTDEPQ